MALARPGVPPADVLLDDPLLLPREVAARCRVSVETIRRWIRKGAVTVVRVGPRGLARIRVSEADKLFASVAREHGTGGTRHTNDDNPRHSDQNI